MPPREVVRCNVTASLLDSGRVLANVANAAAVVAGWGCLIIEPMRVRLLLAGSILFWLVECYYAARVAIDSSLFRALSADPDGAGRELDALLNRTRSERSLEDRSRGALALWRKQIAAVIIQLALLATGLILRVISH